MVKKSVKPANTPWISPYLMVRDVDTAIKFYQKAFGFNVRDVSAGPDGTPQHAELTYHDQLIMIGKEGSMGGASKSPASSGVVPPINLYVYCEDVDKFFNHAVKVGASGEAKPEDTLWGDRMCCLKDPEGYIWCFATHVGAEEVKKTPEKKSKK